MPGFVDKNRRYLFVLALFLFLFWLVTLQVKGGRLPLLERPVLAVNGFIGRVVTWPYRTVNAVLSRYVLLVRTERENRRLREELRRLTLENRLTGELLIENERLRDALGFQKLSPPGSVTAQDVGQRGLGRVERLGQKGVLVEALLRQRPGVLGGGRGEPSQGVHTKRHVHGKRSREWRHPHG